MTVHCIDIDDFESYQHPSALALFGGRHATRVQVVGVIMFQVQVTPVLAHCIIISKDASSITMCERDRPK
jgi:hypothetical protein